LWLAEDAVGYELVSEQFSLIFGRFQGIFRYLQGKRPEGARRTMLYEALTEKFPTHWNREFVRAIREFCWLWGPQAGKTACRDGLGDDEEPVNREAEEAAAGHRRFGRMVVQGQRTVCRM
jgi:hypothetical protein